MSNQKKYKDHIVKTIPIGCIRRFNKNKSLASNLSNIFDYLGEVLKKLYNFNQCLHLFINKSLREVHILITEDHSLNISQRKDKIQSLPFYQRLELSQDDYNFLKSIYEKEAQVNERKDVPIIKRLYSGMLQQIFPLLKIRADISPEDNVLLVPFDFSGLNLGIFLLWKKRGNEININSPEDENLRGEIASTYFFLKNFFEREYSIASEDTYLPSFYASGSANVAILFADIENYPFLMEKIGLRENKGFKYILNRHCEEMAKIIQFNGWGRIDRFFGAGVSAIFGEHEDNPCKTVGSALHAASRMVNRFIEIKREFLEMAFGENYELEYNEPLDVRFKVGIDYGLVLFDYLGDERYKEYSAVGDHVNFAKWLEYKALRFDDKGRLRKPILFSSTVERCIHNRWLRNKEKYDLKMTEKSFTYTVFGIDANEFDENEFHKSIENNDWKFKWNCL